MSTIGRRIALHRRRRGLSQRVLAGLVGRSESWLSQVERGVRSVDRHSVLVDLAAVLHVDLAALTGRPDRAAASGAPFDEGVDDVRRLLTSYTALTTDATAWEPVRGAEEVQTRAAMLHRRYQAAHYGQAVHDLPSLLIAADQMWAAAGGRHEHALACSSVYVAGAKLVTKLGASDLATTLADRAAMTSAVSGLLVPHGMAIYQVVCALLVSNRTSEAGTLAVSMAERLTLRVRDDDPSLISVTGALWLIAAVIAGRQADDAQAQERLDRAADLAALLGADGNHAWTAFGPTNVAVHRVSVAAELGDPAGALAAAADVDVLCLPVGLRSRRAQIHLDLAWAHSRRKQVADATLHLLEAGRVAPEIVRYNLLARETLHAMLSGRRTAQTRTLADLAARAGALHPP